MFPSAQNVGIFIQKYDLFYDEYSKNKLTFHRQTRSLAQRNTIMKILRLFIPKKKQSVVPSVNHSTAFLTP